MDDILLTWYQALQLLALGPCLFVIFFLAVSGRKFLQLIVPALYFLSLASSFMLPLLDVLPSIADLRGWLLVAESLTPSLSFLLIIQFITGNVPRFIYWSILAVPLVGGGFILYATTITKGEVCIYEHLCTDPIVIKRLYEIFTSSLTFLLTIFIYTRTSRTEEGTPYQRQHRFALIMALIILNLILLGIWLAQISDYFDADRIRMATTVVRIGFIYLVLTSVFRVFDRSFEIAYDRVPHLRPTVASARDLMLADEIRTLLVRDHLQRDMNMSRSRLAAKLAVTEHYLSHVINQCFSQNFSSLINDYRVMEAKERLTKEDTAITVIAFEVGFSSIPSFNRVFKLATGMSPSEYRLKFRASQV